jgi:prepilin peptidase CpaA
MLQIAILTFFPALMAFAALSDLLTMTIPNRVSLILLVLFVLFALVTRLGPSAIAWHLGCGGAVLVGTFAMFAFGWIGGGDAKLASAVAIWMGFDHLADYGLYAALIGGGLTLLILGLRYAHLPLAALRVAWVARLHDRDSGVPYGIALAAAGLILYPETYLWHVALA